MLMDQSKSVLGTKLSEFVYTYDLIGTDKMLMYKRLDKNIILLTKNGVILETINTGIEFTYEQFIDQARHVFTEIINRADDYIIGYKSHLS